MLRHICTSQDSGRKLKNVARAKFPLIATKKAFALAIKEERIKVNDISTVGGSTLKKGDVITLLGSSSKASTFNKVRASSSSASSAAASLVGASPLEICYHDNHALVVFKPAGTLFDVALLHGKVQNHLEYQALFLLPRPTAGLIVLVRQTNHNSAPVTTCICQVNKIFKQFKIRCRVLVRGEVDSSGLATGEENKTEVPVPSSHNSASWSSQSSQNRISRVELAVPARSASPKQNKYHQGDEDECKISALDIQPLHITRSNAEDYISTLFVWPVYDDQASETCRQHPHHQSNASPVSETNTYRFENQVLTSLLRFGYPVLGQQQQRQRPGPSGSGGVGDGDGHGACLTAPSRVARRGLFFTVDGVEFKTR